MAYFNHPPEQDYQQPAPRHFDTDQQDWADDADDEWDDLPPEDDDLYFDEDDDLTEEERREARNGRFRVAAGVGDLFGVIAGTVVILLLIALLVSLVTWVQSDVSQTFTLWSTKL